MRTIKTIKQFMLLIMTVSLVTLTGCKSDDDNATGGGSSSGTITASIDGSSFTSMEISSKATKVSATGTLILQGTNSNGEGLVMTINAYSGTGEYPIDSSGLNPNTGIYTETDISNPANTQSWQSPYQNSPMGSIKITEDTGSDIKGEFSFMAKNAGDNSLMDITSGAFNLTIQSL